MPAGIVPRSVIDFRVHLGLGLGTFRLRCNLLFLNIPHYVDDALVNPHQIPTGQGAWIRFLHVLKNGPLAIGLVNGQRGIPFQPSNLDCGLGPLAEQRDELTVELIDFLSPILDVHTRPDLFRSTASISGGWDSYAESTSCWGWNVDDSTRICQLVSFAAGRKNPGMKTASVRLDGMEIFYEIDGSGAPLLLLHGGGGCHEDWVYAGRDQFVGDYTLIMPDARGHGRSTNPLRTITHRQCALDTLALLDHLGIERCQAIGLSMGANILLHMATMQPGRIEAMVLVSAAMYFPEQARAVMRRVPVDNQPAKEWETMRKRHKLGDDQIVALWEWQRSMGDCYDDMNFTPPLLGTIQASTLIAYGDRDFLYPVEMGIEMYRAIPRSALWVVPNGGHGPVFLDAAPQFVQIARAFFRGCART